MVLQNYQNLIELTSKYVAFCGGFKCLCKIHLNTQCLEVRHHSNATKVFYMCSSLFQLSYGSRNLNQAKKEQMLSKAEQNS